MGTGPLRYVARARPIRVTCGHDGTPRVVVVAGRGRQVVSVRDEWLVQDRWWTDHPVDRHFFELVLEPGRVMVLYRDRAAEWFAYG